MPVAIELFLDDPAAGVVRKIWRGIAEAGISQHLNTSGVRPHVTLAVGDEVDDSAVAAVLGAWAEGVAPRSVSFTDLGLTPSESPNIFLTPVVTVDLLELHAGLHQKLTGLVNRPWERYFPGRWVPHCTLVERVPSDAVGRCLEIGRIEQFPIAARLGEVGVVQWGPLNQRCTFQLTGKH